MYYAIDKVLYAYLSMTQYQCNDSIATMQQYHCMSEDALSIEIYGCGRAFDCIAHFMLTCNQKHSYHRSQRRGILLHTLAIVAHAYNMPLTLPQAVILLHAFPFIPSNLLWL